MNPILQMLNKSPAMPVQNNPLQMIQQFQQFRQQMQGRDPKAMVDQLVQSGQINQQQLNNLIQQAQSLRGLFK